MKGLWFSPIDETLKALEVDASTGLSDEEVEIRLRKYGLNKLQAKKRKTILQIFFAQLDDALIYVLFSAVIITFFMHEYIDAIIIFLVIIINALLGLFQEVKAGNAIEALRKLSNPNVLVRRNSAVKEVDSEQIVPGDILVLDAGRMVAADLRLVESHNLQI